MVRDASQSAGLTRARMGQIKRQPHPEIEHGTGRLFALLANWRRSAHFCSLELGCDEGLEGTGGCPRESAAGFDSGKEVAGQFRWGTIAGGESFEVLEARIGDFVDARGTVFESLFGDLLAYVHFNKSDRDPGGGEAGQQFAAVYRIAESCLKDDTAACADFAEGRMSESAVGAGGPLFGVKAQTSGPGAALVKRKAGHLLAQSVGGKNSPAEFVRKGLRQGAFAGSDTAHHNKDHGCGSAEAVSRGKAKVAACAIGTGPAFSF